jgi:hypothetical protein
MMIRVNDLLAQLDLVRTAWFGKNIASSDSAPEV